MLEYNAGLIDAIEYYMTVYKMTEDQAVEFRARMLERPLPVEEEPEPEGDDGKPQKPKAGDDK